MKSRIVITLITIISVMSAGCTTMRSLEAKHTELSTQLTAGDQLRIFEKSGRRVDMAFTRIDSTSLHGTTGQHNSLPVQVAIADIRKIEVKKISGVKTVLLVAGSALTVAAVSAALSAAAAASFLAM